MYEKLASKYRMSINQAKDTCRNMEQMAAQAGLDFQLDTLVLTNTFDAHRLALFAKTKGLSHEMTDRLLKAYYTDSKNIGDHKALVELAEEVGLNGKEVAELLASNKISDDVRGDEREAQELGIQSIPFFLINKKHAITGAQSTEVFVETLNNIIKEDGAFSEENDL